MSRGARHSFLLQRVLETADSVLDLAFDLVGLAVSLQLGIASRPADGRLDRAFELFHRSRDPILVHDQVFLLWLKTLRASGDRIGRVRSRAAVCTMRSCPITP